MPLIADEIVFPAWSLNMHPDIVIVRHAEGFRLLHGHLRLANLLRVFKRVSIDVPGEGAITIAQTRDGLHVNKGQERYRLLPS
jgi:hypothetical protein